MKERCLVIDLWYTCMNFRSFNYFNSLWFPFCCSGMGRKNKFSGSASSNLVGKFTQSVRRIVQDVKDEGSPSKFNVSFRVPFRGIESKPRRENHPPGNRWLTVYIFRLLPFVPGRWYEPRGANRDQRAAASGPGAPGGVIRHGEKGISYPNEQVRRLQKPAKRVQPIPDAEIDD